MLGGFGNLEDNILWLPDSEMRAAALRSYDRATGNWSICWLDSRVPGQLDVPDNGVTWETNWTMDFFRRP